MLRLVIFCILFLLECILIIPGLGSYGGGMIISDEIAFIFFVLVLFIINSIIAIIYTVVRNKVFDKIDSIIVTLLLGIFLFIPLNMVIIEAKQTYVAKQKKDRSIKTKELFAKKIGDTLTPFYAGEGTEDEKLIQKLREGLATKSTYCETINYSFVTEDLQYIVLSCQNKENETKYYICAILPPEDVLARCKLDLMTDFSYPMLLSEDDFTQIYDDPKDETIRFVRYKDKFYLIRKSNPTYVDFKSQIRE